MKARNTPRTQGVMHAVRILLSFLASSALILLTPLAQAAPTVNFYAPAANAKYALPATVTLTASVAPSAGTTIASVQFLVDGQVVTTLAKAPFTTPWAPTTAGTYSLTVHATDSAGASTDSPVKTITVQANLPPTINFYAPANNAKYALPATIPLTASVTGPETNTPIATVDFLVNGQVVTTLTKAPFTTTWTPTTAGTYTLTVHATDSAGASADSPVKTITVEANLPPTINFYAPANNAKYALPATVTLTASVTDPDLNTPVATVDFLVNGQVVTTLTKAPFTTTWTPTTAGTYTLTVHATDSAGASADSATKTVTIEANAPPTINFSAPANNAKYALPATVTLTASVTDPDLNTPVASVDFLVNGQVVTTLTKAPFTTTWAPTTAGTYTLTVHATDSAGASADSPAKTIIVEDNLPPTINFYAPANNAKYALPATIPLTASVTDPDANTPVASVQFLVNGQVVSTLAAAPFTYAWTPTTAGTYSLTVHATDSAGASADSPVKTVTVEANLPPTINFSAPANNAKYALPATVTLTANVSDPEANTPVASVDFLVNGQVVTTLTKAPFTTTWTPTTAGTYTLTVHATDSAGASADSPVKTVTIEANAPPTINFSAPANNAKYALPATIPLTASVTDPDLNTPVASVDFLVNGQVVTTLTKAPFTTTWTPTVAGTYTLTVHATDSAGASADSPAKTVIVEANLPPTINFYAPANNAKYALPATIPLTASVTDPDANTPVASVQFLINGQVVSTLTAAPFTYAWTPTAAGTYTLTVRATDSAGASADSPVKTVTIEANAPPVVSLTAPANNAKYTLPATVTLTASATDPDLNTPVASVQFLVNGQVVSTLTAAPFTATWTPTVAGTYSLTVRATDSAGASTDSAARTVTITAASNLPPTVTLTSPSVGAVGIAPASFTLTANAADSDGTIAKVEFYNGATLVGTMTAAPYTMTLTGLAVGSYSLTAKATDNLGATTTSAATLVTVNANQPPVVSLTSPSANQATPAPGTFTVTANATDADGTIAKVEFYQGTTLIGTATAAPYTMTWSNVPAGSYSLTAKATDNLGAVTTSAPVAVAVKGLPTVSLTSPTANALIAAPATIVVTANATDTDGTIARVEFYNGTTLIGTATAAPYTMTWSNVPSGSYSFSARAIDTLGGQVSSSPVPVTVDAPPTVTLTGPSAGTVGIAPASFTLTANAADSDGTIARVEFYQGAALIGTATAAPYTVTWSNVTPGNYSLTAVATDNLGMQTTSATNNVSVIANSPPTISLTSPTQNQSFKAPASITLTANASDPDNNLAKVEFFQNGTLIATVLMPPFTANWSHVVQGSYQITAVATDGVGAQTTSAPISITVTPADASLYYIQADHLGTPRRIIDESNTVVWRNLPTTESFGNSPPEENPANSGTSFRFNLRFPGQYFDQESGLNYNGFRDYNPATGGYNQSDPIGLAAGPNTYGYVNGNPVSRIDPTGEVALPLITGGVGMVAGLAGSLTAQVARRGLSCVDWQSVLLAGASGFVNGALLPFVGGGLTGAAALGAATNAAQTVAGNLLQNGTTTSSGGDGYPMLQSLVTGAIGGAIGGAMTPVPGLNPSVAALLQPSLQARTLASQAGVGNLARGTAGGAVSNIPDPCSCNR